jgi:rhodanese-related sulfurtransferase
MGGPAGRERRTSYPTKSAGDVRADLIARREIALLDVREEELHAEGHPLFAANLPLSRIELEVYGRVPRLTAQVVVFDNGEGVAGVAAEHLTALGYTDVRVLEGGLEGWRQSGGELFRDVNAPSKAFGELVEAQRHTPSLSAQEVKALIDARADAVIVDARRFDEFQLMSIPTATSVPGAELTLRVPGLAPHPDTRVIVNCAGRTRSIIGAQSLINAGIPNRVAALRNGTIGWTLAGLPLEHGETRTFSDVNAAGESARSAARRVADQAGVARTNLDTVGQWLAGEDTTVYRFDVRTPDEYRNGHVPGFRSVPGGQLVQETDVYSPVRGARLVLADDDGVRANMTASWLAQMAWSVFVLDGTTQLDFTERGPWIAPLPPLPRLPAGATISRDRLRSWLEQDSNAAVVVLDFALSTQYAKRHLPGAWFALRSQFARLCNLTCGAERYVLTSPDGVAALFAWEEVSALTGRPVFVLDGGTDAWVAAGFTVDECRLQYASPPIDRYRRPYEGVDVSASSMENYLEWEYGLVEQLRRDGTHGFFVI